MSLRARQSRNQSSNRYSPQRHSAATPQPKMRKVGFTTKCAMILCSPAENENGGISFHRVPSSTRHSRARGYDGTQAGLFVLIPKRVFSKEITKDTKVFVGCASRTGRSRNVSRKDVKAQRKSIVISNEERNPCFEQSEKSFS